MQVLRQHKRLVLIVVVLVVVLIVSLVVLQQTSKPSATPVPSPVLATPSAIPTQTSPAATATAPSSSASSSFSPPQMPGPTPSGALYPGEATTYQNQSLTPISDFVGDFISTSLSTPDVDQSTYSLVVTDLVNQPTNFTYSDLVNNFKPVLEVVPILCVEGWSANVLWQGVPISDLLNETGVNSKANTLIFYGADGYSSALPLSYVLQNNLILAYKMNNVTLTTDTGFPLILVAQNQYGYKWVKYVTEIDVSNNSSYLGYWESRGYPNNATISNSGGTLNSVAIGEIAGASAAVIIAAVAIYLILVKNKNMHVESAGHTKSPSLTPKTAS